jgi:ABC-type branched-subunit amino acid transport system ATPase component
MRVDSLVTGYGGKQVLNGVTIEVRTGEIVALIGHNGAGKSTLLKAVFGVMPSWSGEVIIEGTVRQPNPYQMIKAGVAYVPQGKGVFRDLTVRENLEMGAATCVGRGAVQNQIERVTSLFPLLRPRMKQIAGTLSGGERQLLALAIAYMASPSLLLLDEPSLGISSALVSEIFTYIKQMCAVSNLAVIIVEQKVREVLRLANRVYIMRTGAIVFSGESGDVDDKKLGLYYF